jgi:hypothetical protein
MDQLRHRFIQLNVAVVAFHIVTTVICVALRWPAQFGGAGDPDNVARRCGCEAPPLARRWS